MGTKRRRNSKLQEEGAANNGRLRMKKDVVGRAVIDVIERKSRNLQRASAVLALLSVAVRHDEEDIDAGDITYVARQLIDGATDALDRVELGRAVKKQQQQRPP
jgi:hypothetical protein